MTIYTDINKKHIKNTGDINYFNKPNINNNINMLNSISPNVINNLNNNYFTNINNNNNNNINTTNNSFKLKGTLFEKFKENSAHKLLYNIDEVLVENEHNNEYKNLKAADIAKNNNKYSSNSLKKNSCGSNRSSLVDYNGGSTYNTFNTSNNVKSETVNIMSHTTKSHVSNNHVLNDLSVSNSQSSFNSVVGANNIFNNSIKNLSNNNYYNSFNSNNSNLVKNSINNNLYNNTINNTNNKAFKSSIQNNKKLETTSSFNNNINYKISNNNTANISNNANSFTSNASYCILNQSPFYNNNNIINKQNSKNFNNNTNFTNNRCNNNNNFFSNNATNFDFENKASNANTNLLYNNMHFGNFRESSKFNNQILNTLSTDKRVSNFNNNIQTNNFALNNSEYSKTGIYKKNVNNDYKVNINYCKYSSDYISFINNKINLNNFDNFVNNISIVNIEDTNKNNIKLKDFFYSFEESSLFGIECFYKNPEFLNNKQASCFNFIKLNQKKFEDNLTYYPTLSSMFIEYNSKTVRDITDKSRTDIYNNYKVVNNNIKQNIIKLDLSNNNIEDIEYNNYNDDNNSNSSNSSSFINKKINKDLKDCKNVSFFEEANIYNRPVFTQRINDIFDKYSYIKLEDLKLKDVTENSWFSILWTPQSLEYGVTEVSFLVYYSFNSLNLLKESKSNNNLEYSNNTSENNLCILGILANTINEENELFWFSKIIIIIIIYYIINNFIYKQIHIYQICMILDLKNILIKKKLNTITIE